MKKFACLLLVILFSSVVMCTCIGVASEEQGEKSPIDANRYQLTGVISATLRFSGSTATASGAITAHYATATCKISARLQQQQSDGSWKTLKTWSKTGNGGAEAGGTYTVSHGSYRTYVTATVTYNGEQEFVTKVTDIKTY